MDHNGDGWEIRIHELINGEYHRTGITTNTKDVLKNYSWSMFITAAIMCGCDYISNIPRVGSNTAFKLV